MKLQHVSVLRRSHSAPADLCCEGVRRGLGQDHPSFCLSRKTSFAEGVGGVLPLDPTPLPTDGLALNDDVVPSSPVLLSADPAFNRGIAAGGRDCWLDEDDAEVYGSAIGQVLPGDEGDAVLGLRQGSQVQDIEDAVAEVFETMVADIAQQAVLELPTIAHLLEESGLAPPTEMPSSNSSDYAEAMGAHSTCGLGAASARDEAMSSRAELSGRQETQTGQISLSQVLQLLQEIRDALEPVQDLVLQAAERLDGRTVDTQTWVSLADAINMIHLRVKVLYRIACRSRQGVDIAELLHYEGEEAATSGEVLEAFAKALTSAMLTVLGSGSVTAEEADQLETRLRRCARALVHSLGERSKQTACSGAPLENVASEVLAGTSASMLVALLQDAGWVLSMAVTVSDE